jgi:ABC-type dipeptide/oligopeptide/nickel transport system ATPase component
LSFEGLRMTLETKTGAKEILDGSIRGRAKPGRMLAVMGPSGAGKSSVLHALAGRVKENPKLKLFGNRYINGAPVSGDSLIPAAFIEQEVDFFPHVRNIQFAQGRYSSFSFFTDDSPRNTGVSSRPQAWVETLQKGSEGNGSGSARPVGTNIVS